MHWNCPRIFLTFSQYLFCRTPLVYCFHNFKGNFVRLLVISRTRHKSALEKRCFVSLEVYTFLQEKILFKNFVLKILHIVQSCRLKILRICSLCLHQRNKIEKQGIEKAAKVLTQASTFKKSEEYHRNRHREVFCEIADQHL